MTEFLSRTFRCPVCNTEFFWEVPIDIQLVGEETDFRPVFEGPDPIVTDMVACPTCRYAGYAGAFEASPIEEDEEPDRTGVPPPIAPLGIPDEEDLDALRRWIRRGELREEAGIGLREPTPAERYVLAARCREFLVEDDPLPLADLVLRGAWAARSTGDAELERELLAEAAEHLDIALDEGKVPADQRGRMVYLAAELARRSGDFARAVDLFGQVDDFLDLDEEEDLRLHRLARRMESLASIQSAVNARMPTGEELEASSTADELDWDEEGDEGEGGPS